MQIVGAHIYVRWLINLIEGIDILGLHKNESPQLCVLHAIVR